MGSSQFGLNRAVTVPQNSSTFTWTLSVPKAVWNCLTSWEKYVKLWTQGKIKIKLILKLEDHTPNLSGRFVVDANTAETLILPPNKLSFVRPGPNILNNELLIDSNKMWQAFYYSKILTPETIGLGYLVILLYVSCDTWWQNVLSKLQRTGLEHII